MRSPIISTLATILLGCTTTLSPAAAEPAYNTVDHYNVLWDSPSKDAKGSMPIGNGDIGLNAWVEPSGDLCFFIGKTDTWDENQRLLKLGKVRVKLTPALATANDFRQELKLRDGVIEIRTPQARISVWVDANHPVIHVDAKSADGQPIEARASFEIWRKEKRSLGNSQSGGGNEYFSTGYTTLPAFSYPDVVLPATPRHIGWYHRNVESPWLASLQLQKNEALARTEQDPILNRTMGAILRGDNFVPTSNTELKTAKPAPEFSLRVHVLTRITDTPEQWLAALEKQAEAIDKIPAATRQQEHRRWWEAYWNRSWIFVDGNHSLALPVNPLPWRVGVDSNGGSRFGGAITGPRVIGHALDAREIAGLASQPPATGTNLSEEPCTTGCTVAAWIKPAAGEAGRIIDKCTAGKPDGLTFDTNPGLSLRWIVGDNTMIQPNCLKAGEWQHVAATVDTGSGLRRIFLNGNLLKEERGDPAAEALTRAYTLQRFMNACAGRGAYPIKFNGSIFTVDNKYDADYRAWGGCYWFQNTRHSYWPMLTSGDHDLMQPFFDYYMRVLPARKLATQNYYGHAGAFFPETMSIWGNYTDQGDLGYGINRNGKPDGLTDNTYVRRYWQGGLEIMVMMLDYHDLTRNAAFRDKTLLPFAREVLTFFDQHWKRGADGKILFDPAQSLETWHVAKNPLPEIAGLRYVIPRVLVLPAAESDKTAWRKTLADLPPIPTHTDANGVLRLAPAETYGQKANVENPELYAVFPYPIYTLAASKDSLAIGKSTFASRAHRDNFCWRQDPIQAALLGLGDEAARDVTARATSVEPGFRFPAMWAAGSDWMPDQDHVGVMMTALQRMILQTDGDRILLLPAWPKIWNGSFKLHAPRNTIVEGVIKAGKIEALKVTPESRRKDVEILQPE